MKMYILADYFLCQEWISGIYKHESSKMYLMFLILLLCQLEKNILHRTY